MPRLATAVVVMTLLLDAAAFGGGRAAGRHAAAAPWQLRGGSATTMTMTPEDRSTADSGVEAGPFASLSSQTYIPTFPATLSDVAVEAAAAVERAMQQKTMRTIVNVNLPSLGVSSIGANTGHRLDLSALLGDRTLTNTPDGWAAPESPTLMLLCSRTASQLAQRGLPRVRFVTQNLQTAMRLQQALLNREETGGAALPDCRVSVIGMDAGGDGKSSGGKKQRPYGISDDDDLVVMVAPSTEKKASQNMLSAVENVVAAATSARKPVVLLNPELIRRTRFGEGTPYLLAGFQTAFFFDPLAFRRHDSCSAAVLRRWPNDWEVFFNDPASSQGRVYAGTVFDRPSADWLQIRFQDFSIKKPSDLER